MRAAERLAHGQHGVRFGTHEEIDAQNAPSRTPTSTSLASSRVELSFVSSTTLRSRFICLGIPEGASSSFRSRPPTESGSSRSFPFRDNLRFEGLSDGKTEGDNPGDGELDGVGDGDALDRFNDVETDGPGRGERPKVTRAGWRGAREGEDATPPAPLAPLALGLANAMGPWESTARAPETEAKGEVLVNEDEEEGKPKPNARGEGRDAEGKGRAEGGC
jgi:hypothetical protein